MSLPRVMRAALVLLLPPLVLAALYVRALDYELAWTDPTAIGARSMLRGEGELLRAFGEPLHRVRGRADTLRQAYYRPLQVVWLSLVDRHFGSTARALRTASLLVGALCLVLFGVLAGRLLGAPAAALFAALWVAVHPVGIEVYVWIAGSSGALCAVGVMASLLAADACVRAQRGRAAFGLAALSCVALAVALLAKERAAVVPGLLLAAVSGAALLPPANRVPVAVGAGRRAVLLVAAQGGLVALYLFGLRPAVVGSALSGLPPLGGSVVTQVSTALASWPARMGWLFLPLHSSTNDAVALATSPAVPAVWLGAGLALGSLAGWGLLLRAGRPAAAFGLAWLWIAFLPTSGLLPQLHLRGERYLFLSAFGAALLVADGGHALLGCVQPDRRRWLAAAAALLCLGFLAQRTAARLPAWESTLTLFAHELERDPAYPEAHFLLASEHHARGRYGEADTHLRVLLERPTQRPDRVAYVNRIAVTELACANALARGRPEEALEVGQVQPGPSVARTPGVRACVAEAHIALGRHDEALAAYLDVARALGPATPPQLALRIAQLQAQLGHTAEATRWLDRARRAGAADVGLAREVRALGARLRRAR